MDGSFSTGSRIRAFLLAAICVLFSRLAYLLVRQGGRILLRLEAIEQRLAELATAPPAQTQTETETVDHHGLIVGADAPDFELPSLDGPSVSLAEFRAQKVLLTFFNPDCGFCRDMVPDLLSLSPGGSDGRPVTVVVSMGTAERNRELFKNSPLSSRVLLQDGREVAAQYQVGGTPMAYLIDQDGKIASPLAVGAQELLRLSGDQTAATRTDAGVAADNGDKPFTIHRGNRPLSDSRLERNGLRAGTAAPPIHVPRLGGGEVRLADYLGHRVMLVFSDPECEPCQQLTPDLERAHREIPDVSVVVISRGDADKNQEKFGSVTFPVGLQRRWEVSKEYGMFATPIGYLIDEHGVILTDVATGPAEIVALLSRESLKTPLVKPVWKEASQ
jgi:peroxiredoxin